MCMMVNHFRRHYAKPHSWLCASCWLHLKVRLVVKYGHCFTAYAWQLCDMRPTLWVIINQVTLSWQTCCYSKPLHASKKPVMGVCVSIPLPFPHVNNYRDEMDEFSRKVVAFWLLSHRKERVELNKSIKTVRNVERRQERKCSSGKYI